MADYGEGYKYQRSVTAYLASLLSKDVTVKDYHILYEVQEFYPFDDIVLVVNYHESTEPRLYVIQAKSGKIKLEIHKYLKGYNEIMKNKRMKCLENIGTFNKDNIQFWYYACQNLSSQTTFLQEGSEKKELGIKQSILDNNESIICHKVYKLSSKDEEVAKEHQKFFNDFYIFLGQPNAYIITNKLKDMWKSNDAPQVIEYLDKYFTKNKNGNLSKTNFEHELLRICLSDSIVMPTKVIPYMKESALAWNDLTLSHDVTIVKSEADIERCLFGCISQSIDVKITIDQWNAFVENGGRLSKEFKENITIKSLKAETLKDWLIQLWTCGEIPMILKSANPILLLKEFSHLKQHYVIIDPNPEKRCKEMESYSLNAIKNLGQATANQLLQKVLVSMQGGKPASLYTVINNEKQLMESLTCLDILKLMEPRRLYISSDCLDSYDYRLFIIETVTPETMFEEDYEANGDNIFIYTQLDEGNEVYERVRQDPTLKNYKIFQLRLDDDKLMLANQQGLPNIENVNRQQNIDENEWHESLIGLEGFQIDQYGKSVYSINKDHIIPIIGDVKKIACVKYLRRHMRKGALGNLLNDESADSTIKFSGTIFSDQDFFKEMRGKLCVVTGEAGIGKTTLLQLLMQVCEPQFYVLFCNLVRFQVDMRATTKKLLKNPLNFLWAKQEVLSYHNFLNVLRKGHKRIILILDSFDEVIPSCKEQALELLRKLNQETCIEKIIIGSRLLTVDLLINQFETEVAKLESLSNECVENWGFDNLQEMPAEFATNPLYLDMLRIISQSSDVDFQTLKRWNLYEGIVDSKIKRYCQRIGHVFDEYETENILKFHWELAVKFIFGSNQVTEKFVLNKRIKFSNFARLGIITFFNEDEEPVFVHHTFAEFFVAEWLIKATNKEDAKYIDELMLTNRQFDILGLHCEMFPLHKAVLDITAISDNLYFDQISNLCKGNKAVLLQVDGIGRTALHIAAIRYRAHNSKCLETIIQYMSESGYNLYLGDGLMGWTWIDYCERNLRFDITAVCPNFFVIHKAYWSYYATQVRNLIPSLLWEKVDFLQVYYKIIRYPSLFNIIDDLLFLRYFDNEEFIRFRNLCMRSEISAVELPEYFELDELKLTPLHMATIYSNTNAVIACIERGDNIKAVDFLDCTPLYYSICKQKSEIVELLLQQYADFQLEFDDSTGWVRGNSIFQLSLRTKNKNITKILMEKIDIDRVGSFWLYDAIQFGDIEVLDVLLKTKIDPNEEILVDVYSSFEHEIVSRNIFRTFRKFHDYNYDIGAMPINELLLFADALNNLYKLQFSDYKNIKNHTRPLITAILSGRTDIVELLLKNGADINSEIESDDNTSETKSISKTPLCYAIRSMNVDMVELLLQNSANVNDLGSDGFTPLTAAIHEATLQKLFNELIVYKDFREEVDCIVEKLSCEYRYDMPFYIRNYVNATEKFDSSLIKPAFLQRSLELVEILLRHGADVNCKSNYDLTPIDMAILYQNNKMAELLLRKGANPHCNTLDLLAILEFVSTENMNIVELLLKNGADPNFKNACDMTPLYTAARRRNPDLIKLLFEYGAHTNIVTSTNTLFTKAIQYGEIGTAVWLLGAIHSSNPTHNSTYPDEVLNLIKTVESQENINLADVIDTKRDVKFIERLSEYKADLTNPTGMCYVNALVELNNKEVDQIFLRNFMEQYSEEVDCYTAVGYAAKLKNKGIIAILARNGEDVNSANEEGRTPLVSVLQGNVHKSVVEFLLENQADVNMADESGDTPLITAIDMTNIDIVKLLLKNQTSVNYISKDGLTPLTAAINKNHFVITSILLKNGADVNFVYEGGLTPLYVAILKGNTKIIKMLLSYGAHSNIETCGKLLLYSAVKSSYDEIVSVLLSEVDLDRLNVPGHQDVVQRVFRNRADVNTTYEFGSTLLHLATKTGNSRTVANLLECAANPNQVDDHGRTALYYAAEMNMEGIVWLLHKTDVTIRDNNGLTPFDYANRNENLEIINILLKFN